MALPYERDLGSARVNLDQANQYFNRSPESFDNAAARVRNRINAQSSANQMQTRNKFQNRAMQNSGLAKSALQRDRNAGLSEYSGALVDLTDKFAERDLQRGQGLAGLGSQFANLGQIPANYDIQTKQQELQRLLGLGSQETERRGQDINKGLQESSQAIQQSLGNLGSLRDILGLKYEFGNTRLGAGDSDLVDQIVNYMLSQTGGR